MQAQPTIVECSAPTASPEQPTSSLPQPGTMRKSASHATFLADASKRLAGSLDLQRTLDCLVELGVRELGEACLVYPFPDGHTLGRLAAARHGDVTRTKLLMALAESALREPHGWRPLLGVASSGRPAVLSQLRTADWLGDGRPPHVLLTDLGIKTAALVPVIREESTLAIAVFLSNRTRFYTPTRVQLAQELAGRFALALQAARLYDECRRTLDEVQESLATTIHDLMSPLTYIKGTAQRLERAEESITDSVASLDFAQRLKAIDAAANRMAAALTTLLETTRPIPTSLPGATHRRTDLLALVRSVIAAEQPMAMQHTLQFCEASSALEGAWDPEHIQRLLGNLICNAVKYSPPGSTVQISLASEVDSEGRWATLRVTDQGVGIPARDLPFVFEPFRRGSNIGSVGGSGLGLASVWQIVKSNEGRLWIDSQEGKGTSVTVRLPLADPCGPTSTSP